MKKNKFISVLTSAAMTAASVSGAVAFTVTAENSNVGLKMVSDKTTFTVDELSKGDIRATVYVDSTGNFTVNDNITSVEFKLRPNVWGVVDPINLKISEPNAYSTDKGNSPAKGAFGSITSTTGSIWDTEVPGRLGYSAWNYLEANPDLEGYKDGYEPKVTIMTDSQHGKLRTESANAECHVAEFEIVIPADTEPGEYTINFLSAEYSAGSSTDTSKMYPIENLEPIIFKITDNIGSTDSTEGSTETTNSTEENTESTNSTENNTDSTEPSEDDFLIGDANLDKKVNVRDCAAIATALAKAAADSLPQKNSDYNQDGKINVRDAAALAKDISMGKV